VIDDRDPEKKNIEKREDMKNLTKEWRGKNTETKFFQLQFAVFFKLLELIVFRSNKD
jgi:hypothetical protein